MVKQRVVAKVRGEHQAAGRRRDHRRVDVMLGQVLVGLDHADDADDQEQPLVYLGDRPAGF